MCIEQQKCTNDSLGSPISWSPWLKFICQQNKSQYVIGHQFYSHIFHLCIFPASSKLIYLANVTCIHQQYRKQLTGELDNVEKMLAAVWITTGSSYCNWWPTSEAPYIPNFSQQLTLHSFHRLCAFISSNTSQAFASLKYYFFLNKFLVVRYCPMRLKGKANRRKQQVLYPFERFQLHKLLWQRLLPYFISRACHLGPSS